MTFCMDSEQRDRKKNEQRNNRKYIALARNGFGIFGFNYFKMSFVIKG